jgi:hypothetical protein
MAINTIGDGWCDWDAEWERQEDCASGNPSELYALGYLPPNHRVPAIKYEVYVLDWLVLITHETSVCELVDLYIMIEIPEKNYD